MKWAEDIEWNNFQKYIVILLEIKYVKKELNAMKRVSFNERCHKATIVITYMIFFMCQ